MIGIPSMAGKPRIHEAVDIETQVLWPARTSPKHLREGVSEVGQMP
jgi:hypothetical protein